MADVADITDYVANGSFASLRENVTYKSEKDYAILVRLADYSNGFDDSKYVYIDKHSYDFLAKSSLQGGEIIMSNVGSVGKLFICPDLGMPMSLAPNTIVIKTEYNRFYYYLLSSTHYQNQIQSITSKTALPKFNKTSFKKIEVSIPPLEKQERIVAELDLLTGIIDKQKQQLKELDTLAQSIFYNMFGNPEYNEKGWGVKTMGEIGSLQRGSGLSKKDLVEEGFPCILYGQIHTKFGAYAERNIAFIPEDLVHTAKIAHSGDLVMALTSEDVEGSCKSVAWLGNYDVAVGSDAAIFSHSENGIYLSYYTQTRAFYNEKAKYARGFKVTHISTKDIATIPVMIPPRLLQDEFALKVQFIEKQKESINRSLAESQKLFDYTMDKYFG